MGVLVDPSRVPKDPSGGKGILSEIQDGAGGLGDALGAGFNGLVGGIGGAILNGLGGVLGGGLFAPVEEAAEEIKNGQDTLNDRLDLLFGVSGYVFSYMSKNVNAEWGSSNTRDMPFDTQLGPSKEAEVKDGKVTLQGKGLWLVMTKCSCRPTNYGGATLLRSNTHIRKPNGDLFHESIAYAGSGGSGGIIGNQTAGGVMDIFPVVVDEVGCTVDVQTYTGAWRWWDGGYRKSMLAAIRFSEDIENFGEADVPDEDKPS